MYISLFICTAGRDDPEKNCRSSPLILAHALVPQNPGNRMEKRFFSEKELEMDCLSSIPPRESGGHSQGWKRGNNMNN